MINNWPPLYVLRRVCSSLASYLLVCVRKLSLTQFPNLGDSLRPILTTALGT